MTDEDKEIITEFLGVEPIMINSARLTAADRKRYYWTNIPNIEQPEDKGILLKDIMQPEDEIHKKYYYDKPFDFYGLDKKVCGKLQLNTHDLLKRVYNPYNKCGTLTAVSGGYQEKKVYIPETGKVRKLTPLEYERMQDVPENYTEGVKDLHRWTMLGNGWTISVIAHIFKYIEVKNEIHT